MKKIIYILMLMMFMVGCDSVTARGRYGSISINDSNYKKSKANGRALGHKNPNNPHYTGGDDDVVNIIFK